MKPPSCVKRISYAIQLIESLRDNVFHENGSTIMIQASGALFCFWYLKGGRLFETGGLVDRGQGAYFFFEKQPNVQNKTLIRYLFSEKEQ